MDVLDVYYVGGFGVMGWVPVSDYSAAQADPLAEHKNDIMLHMNADHKDALITVQTAPVAQGLFDGGGRIGCGQSGLQNDARMPPQLLHFHSGSARMASTVATGSQLPSTRKSARL